MGEAAEVEIYIPKLRLESFPRKNAIEFEPFVNELATRIRWRYEDRKDIRGFRIRDLESGAIVADTDELGPDAEDWIWRSPELKEMKRLKLGIVAVGAFDHIESNEKITNEGNPHHYRDYSLNQWSVENASVFADGYKGKNILALEWAPWPEERFAEVDRVAIGPAEADKYTEVPLYRMGWHKYLVTENGKLLVEVPEYLEGEISMRVVPLYADEQGRPIIPGRFAEFTVDLGDVANAEEDGKAPAAAAGGEQSPASFLKWETTRIEETADIGDQFMAGVFRFENVGPDPVRITRIKSSCGCTTAELEKRLYLPGDTGEILATFEFEGRTGRQTKVIDVYVDGDPDPIRLVLRTTIPRVLSIKPAIQTWALGSEPEAKYTELEVEVDAPVQIGAITSSNPGLLAELETIEAGKRYRLKLTPQNTEKKFQGIVSFETDYPAENPKAFEIRARVK